MANLVLLCGEHHTTVHHGSWRVTIAGDGLPTFHPPPWIDPEQAPRRHFRYALRQLSYDLGGTDPTN